jgi:glycosyltransferase involved in cell wall biosynthesis
VSPDDPTELAHALGRVADDAGLAEQLGRQGRDWAGQFSWDRAAEQQASYFDEVMSGS